MMNDSGSVRVSILMDNTAEPGFACEWGFSAAIETTDELWLWDAGQSAKFQANAALMGIDPMQAAGLALSHGHYDHTGGIPVFREAGYQGPIFAHPGCNETRYSMSHTPAEPIGIAHPLEEYTPVTGSRPLSRMITMITDIARLSGNYEAVKGFSFTPSGDTPDPVCDDAFLLLDTPNGWVVLLGCCHSGLMNSLTSLRERMDIEKVHAVLGGLHLYNADTAAIEESAEACRTFSVDKLAVGHCTGQNATKTLASMLNCEVSTLRSGTRLDFQHAS